nr:hypothetical protein Iba_chr03eCG6890 [Ipomoea batatas]
MVRNTYLDTAFSSPFAQVQRVNGPPTFAPSGNRTRVLPEFFPTKRAHLPLELPHWEEKSIFALGGFGLRGEETRKDRELIGNIWEMLKCAIIREMVILHFIRMTYEDGGI